MIVVKVVVKIGVNIVHIVKIVHIVHIVKIVPQ